MESLQYHLQVAHRSIDERFKRRETHALEDARPQERSIVWSRCAAPHAAEDDDDSAEDVEMSLAPDPCTGHEKKTGNPYAEQVVSCQQRHVSEGALEVDGERDGVGGEQGRQGSCDDREEGEDDDEEVALP